MAEFAELQSFKSSLSYQEMNTDMELMTQFDDMNASVMENPNLSLHGLMGCFSNDNFLSQQPEFPAQFGNNVQGFFQSDGSNSLIVPRPMASVGNESRENKKRKVVTVSESSSGNSTTPVSGTGSGEKVTNKRKNGPGRGKRARCSDKEVEKPKEVVHVRARRGQATDSHSLAERVRREKINERMRCLQDLVPGCYKTMGMAVMLDEIINYVQSLQNQVEFLSMKLSAASSFYDFSMDMEAMQASQATNAYEVQLQEVERLVREGYGGLTSFHSTMPL